MAGNMRSDLWKDDFLLRDQMAVYVGQGIQRVEVLDFVQKDFPQYCWSLPTLDRRLRHFQICYTDRNVSLDTLTAAVKKELSGPGRLLGYRSMYHKIRQHHKLNVPRDLVHAALTDLDPSGLKNRRLAFKKKKEKGCFYSKGPNFVHSLDGHDKLMGFQNHTFPLAIYGSMDSCSRKLLWLKVWTSNKNPKLIAKWYVDYLMECKKMSTYLRLDRGTETTLLSTMHAYLHKDHDINAEETVLYGPSTSNQIERWWRELHERLEKYFKHHLNSLKEEGVYNPNDERHRSILAFVMIPIIQRELDTFKDIIWNPHRIRRQKCTILPHGVPNHIFEFPEKYDLEDCSWLVTEEQIREITDHSGILEIDEDYIGADFRIQCERLIPNVIEADECVDAFVFLKRHLPND